MRIIVAITSLFFALALTACTNTPSNHTQNVDRVSLIRSMTYTHRHLLEQQLGSQLGDIDSGEVLMQSHCDLIRRGVVESALPSQCEPEPSYEQQACVAEYHLCVGSCGTFKKDCPPCEEKAKQCLQNAKTGQQTAMTDKAE